MYFATKLNAVLDSYKIGAAKTILGTILISVCSTASADANDYVPTVYFEATGGMSVHKSEMINNNDTSTTTAIETGIWAGKQRSLGMWLRQEQSTVAFALNKGMLSTTHKEFGIRYRISAFSLGLGLTESKWDAKRPDSADPDLAEAAEIDGDGEPFLDMSSSGAFGALGAFIPLGKTGMIYFQGKGISTLAIQQSSVERSDGETSPDETLAIGNAMEGSIGAHLNLTKKILRGVIGFKLRTHTMTVKDTIYTEQSTNTFVGLRLGTTF